MDTTITIKTSKNLREAAKKMAEELGLNLTAVINAYLKQFIRERKFTVSVDSMPSKRSLALWERISLEADAGKGVSGPFTDVESLFRHLKI